VGEAASTPIARGLQPRNGRQNDLGLDRAADQFHFWNPSERNAFVGKKKAQPAEAALQKGNFKLQDYNNTFQSGYTIQGCSGKRPGVAPGAD
jgi:hypothetical protein